MFNELENRGHFLQANRAITGGGASKTDNVQFLEYHELRVGDTVLRGATTTSLLDWIDF